MVIIITLTIMTFVIITLIVIKVGMEREYQGWVGQGREQFKGGKERTDEVEKKILSSSLSWTSSYSSPPKVRETYNVRDVSSGAKFPDRTCPTLRSEKTESLITFSLKLIFYYFEDLFDKFVDLFHRSDQHSQEWQQPCKSSRYAFLLEQRTYKASQNVDFTKHACLPN